MSSILAGSGGPGPGVGARCGNGLFPLINLPNSYLSFTILVSFILVKYPDRIGLVNTVPTVPTVPVQAGTYGTRTRELLNVVAVKNLGN